ARVQREQSDLLDHHQVALPAIQQAAGPGAGFDTLAVFESYPVDQAGEEAIAIDGMTVTGASGADDTHYPVSIIAYAQPELTIKVKHRAELIPQVVAEGIAARLGMVLDAFAGDASVRVG
ncbi:hypothetical protein HT102_15645, partial [Hoyosella sp. G463]